MEAKNILTKSRLTKAALVALIGIALVGGGSYYCHQQRVTAHARAAEANDAILQNKAEELGLTLTDKDAVKAAVAAAIGKSEGEITWDEVALQDAFALKHHAKGGHEEHKAHPQSGSERGHHPADFQQKDGQPPAPQMDNDMQKPPMPPQGGQAEAPAAPPQDRANAPQQGNAPQDGAAQTPQDTPQPGTAQKNGDKTQKRDARPGLHLVYAVSCQSGGVKYHALVDAASGNVIQCEAIG